MFAALLTASYFNFQNAPRRLTGRLAHHLIDPDLNEDLIVYVYFEAPEQHDNLLFFLKHGLHAKADFVFVINGEYDPVNITFPQADNIRVLQRPNECMDLGTFPIAIRWAEMGRRRYKRYILMNASVRGPFMPVWSNECWSDVFLNRINKEVKMVGLTYNCMFIPHVQSMLLAMDHTSLRIISRNLQCYATKEMAIQEGEIQLTKLIRENGYKAEVMMSGYHSSPNYPDTCEGQGPVDPWYLENARHAYFGMNLHPFETIFHKSNRHIDDHVLGMYTKWAGDMGYSSYDKCRRKNT